MIIEYIFLNVFFSGRIQTLNPYSRDDISSATFSKDTLGMAIRVVEFSNRVYKIRKIFA